MFTRNRLIVPAQLRESLQILVQAEGVTLNQDILKVLDEHVSVQEAEGRLRTEQRPSGTHAAQTFSERRLSVVSPPSDRTRIQPWACC